MKTQAQAPKQLSQDHEVGEAPGLSMAPPAFSLTSGPDEGGGGKKKTPAKSVPKRFEGPLAAKGEGDEHAFAQDDVYQGNTGDCWLTATFAAFARANPSYLEEIIEERPDGKFDVKLFVREGADEESPLVRRTVTVGRTFPTHPDTGFPRYAGLGDDQMEIWVMVLETAAASIMGGAYQDLSDEDPTVAFEMLTGKSSRSAPIYNENSNKYGSDDMAFVNAGAAAPKDKILGLVEKQLESGNAIVLCTKDWGGKKKQVGEFTIIGPHAYSVISVNSAGGTISLMDPYGVYHLLDLPLDLVAKYFVSIDYGPANSGQ